MPFWGEAVLACIIISIGFPLVLIDIFVIDGAQNTKAATGLAFQFANGGYCKMRPERNEGPLRRLLEYGFLQECFPIRVTVDRQGLQQGQVDKGQKE